MKEGLFTKIMAIATAVGAVMAVVAWVLPRRDRTVEEAAQETPVEAIPAVPDGSAASLPGPVGKPTPPEPVTPSPPDPPSGGGADSASEAAADSAQPLQISLGDGEQAVILGGRASLAIAFTRIGEEEFPSLRVEGDGGPKTLALLGPGGRLEFTAAGSRYVASVLRKDLSAKRVDIQVDPQP